MKQKDSKKLLNNIVIITGNVNSGKGTTAKGLKDVGFKILAMSNVLNNPISEKGKSIIANNRKYIDELKAAGKMVSDDITIPLFKAEFEYLIEKYNNIALDGFPRTENQAKWILDNYESEFRIIHNEVTLEEALKRASKRYVCKKCGTSFVGNYETCCGRELTKRNDDKPETVAYRHTSQESDIKEVSKIFDKMRYKTLSVKNQKEREIAIKYVYHDFRI